MTNKEHLAYITGLFDGEGYIGIKKDLIKGRGVSPVFYERISIASIDKVTIDMILDYFKCGSIYLHKPSKLSKRGYYSWETSNLKAIAVIKQIYPYLRIKRPEADLVLALYENKKQKYFKLPQEIVDYRETLYQAVKTLHTFVP